jgi:hypothetical protein
MIAPSEYHLAVLTIIEEAIAIPREELGVETARLFGFDRAGPDLKEEINQQVTALIKMGKIVVDGSMVRAPFAAACLGPLAIRYSARLTVFISARIFGGPSDRPGRSEPLSFPRRTGGRGSFTWGPSGTRCIIGPTPAQSML